MGRAGSCRNQVGGDSAFLPAPPPPKPPVAFMPMSWKLLSDADRPQAQLGLMAIIFT